MVVPKAAIYQTQTFYAKGKVKEVKQLVANLRGESLSSGKTETWNGKMLKIPPVSPSILECSIIRVEYSLMVSAGHQWVGYSLILLKRIGQMFRYERHVDPRVSAYILLSSPPIFRTDGSIKSIFPSSALFAQGQLTWSGLSLGL